MTGTPTPDECASLTFSCSRKLPLFSALTGCDRCRFYRITSRRSRDYLRALPFQQPRDFAQIYPHASSEAVDFLRKTLAFDPLKRITVEQALEHPYMANYRTLSSCEDVNAAR